MIKTTLLFSIILFLFEANIFCQTQGSVNTLDISIFQLDKSKIVYNEPFNYKSVSDTLKIAEYSLDVTSKKPNRFIKFETIENSIGYELDISVIHKKSKQMRFDIDLINVDGQSEISSIIEIDSVSGIKLDENIALIIKPSIDVDNDQNELEPFLAEWITKIAIKHSIDTNRERHVVQDPELVGFCDKSKTKKNKAKLKNAVMLYKDQTSNDYYVIKADKIKQHADAPILWIRAWNDCDLLLKNGSIERYSFENGLVPIEVNSNKKMKFVINADDVQIII